MLSSPFVKLLGISSLVLALTLFGSLAASGFPSFAWQKISPRTSSSGLSTELSFLGEEGEEESETAQVEIEIELDQRETEDDEEDEAIEVLEKAERKIKTALNSTTAIDFRDTPLQDIAAFLRDQHGVQIVFDLPALGGEGFTPDTPITMSLKDVSLRSAMNLMFSQLGLDYRVQDEVLLVTTKAKAVYPKLHEVDDAKVDLESLQEAIMSGIARESWKSAENKNGYATITTYRDDGLLIVQSESVHLLIEAFLEKLEDEYEEDDEDERDTRDEHDEKEERNDDREEADDREE